MTDSTPAPTPDSTPDSGRHRSKRRRFVPVVWTASAAAAVLLGLTITGTLSGFTAEIDNSTNTTGSGTLLMQENDAATGVTCYSNGATAAAAIGTTNTNTCATINKFGGDQTGGLNLAPGVTGTTTTVTIKNAGTIAASQFTLTPGTCTQSNNTGNAAVQAIGAYGSATDFCSKVNVVIKQAGTTVFSGTAAQLAAGTGGATTLPANLGPVAANTAVSFDFTVSLDTGSGNSYQGLALSLPLAWKFTQ